MITEILIKENVYLGLAYSSEEYIISMAGSMVSCRKTWCWAKSQDLDLKAAKGGGGTISPQRAEPEHRDLKVHPYSHTLLPTKSHQLQGHTS